ncbi:hypothetical protein IFM89_000854 [Coptis chinensis]|uniref:Uncharacterized protein n=1 Tax=Coptis chinensis TaxID=261450 RepID=A0A835M910_9MAGN|nr:hypothetical protein IFM89_000854 [Coptis chinensis]
MDILAAGVNKAKEGGSVGRGGFSTRGRGGRGKGRGNFRGRGGGRFGQRGEDQQDEDEDEDEFSVGDNAAGERLAQELGPELTAKLDRVIDDYVEVILPDPEEDAFDEAEDYNMKIECEPEYMVEFDNPDIDEKPPMPLRDVLEKVKPFMMAYEGIKDQAEWEEVVEEVMSTVPHMKQVVDQYCGPDRVTAKQQQQELERVAKTLPDNVPSSVKRYTDRAVLSLQSNPGWGWDKKCQFMDKLVWEVSQQYK